MVNKESVNAATETTNHRWSAVSPSSDPFENGDPVTGRFVLKIGDHLENAETK